jgi:5-methylcytosine-specific restriction endonuclease McrA
VPRNPDMPCAVCGTLLWRGRTSLPPGQAICQPCRRAGLSETMKEVLCLHCGASFRTYRAKFCSRTCFARFDGERRRISTPGDPHYRRQLRERSAPGLGQTQRKRLLDKWRRQLRACVYCGDLATTIDHVLPLVRGGTNHEGNLAPCCKRCNSSKAGWLVVEWRSGLRLPPMREALPWALAPSGERSAA